MGGGGRYPYPKQVWSPAGGWWSRPKNWASNTVVTAIGIASITAWVWSVSARIETRDKQPTRWIPSMMWSKALKDNPTLQEHN
ncbi:protein of unknown function [Taphrina deformans PYCC 5710]|uniref:Uncharacterized protein n=1 Tax=Taphrina deformans (strain PYCC 5710 / ATCC 11124 / CBS 356.35 / IMI 108563 / JCM 9778 / NBRC 8474) TaxID=1097556 RepID=R4XJB3_TAPDE|nr:protein of unknown function [Taphrina deformans PYCC 5710]|eukprot:CCG84559.1 protein of unknown function [Taphrina deformans PYCC 5710]